MHNKIIVIARLGILSTSAIIIALYLAPSLESFAFAAFSKTVDDAADNQEIAVEMPAKKPDAAKGKVAGEAIAKAQPTPVAKPAAKKAVSKKTTKTTTIPKKNSTPPKPKETAAPEPVQPLPISFPDTFTSLTVNGPSTFNGTLQIAKAATLQDNLIVLKDASVNGSLTIGGNLIVSGAFNPQSVTTGFISAKSINAAGPIVGSAVNAPLGSFTNLSSQSASFGGDSNNTFSSKSPSVFSSTVNIQGASTLDSTLSVTGAATLASSLSVTGNTTVSGLTTGDITPSSAAVLLSPVDSTGNVGTYTSLVLDSSGFPVISYYDVTNANLKVTHCNDANCAGSNESTVAVDSTDDVGTYSSITLDSSGFPVISYYDVTNANLKVTHCNDANCAGSNESTVAVDSGGNVGQYTSLVLDSSGYPVISYYDVTNTNLKVIHCNDVNCAGGDESTVTADSTGAVGQYTSLALDTLGYPVVSYYDTSNTNLKVIHCNDANCAGADESTVTADATGSTGTYTSLVLDSLGYPVISYSYDTSYDLKVTHCNDVNCAGDNESTATLDSTGLVGTYTSLRLDALGYPVVSYYDSTNYDLKITHCNDANCSGDDESTVGMDIIGMVGQYASLRLDASGYPVVSHYDATHLDLELGHCGDANCSSVSGVTAGKNIGSAANSFDTIYALKFYSKEGDQVRGFDVAENYQVEDLTIEAGDLVVMAGSGNNLVEKSSQPYQENLLGVVSTKPGILLTEWESCDASLQRPVALSGRVPVKVTSANGTIKVGDFITSSSLAGFGQKATASGMYIGKALSGFDPESGQSEIIPCPAGSPVPAKCGKISIFVSLGWKGIAQCSALESPYGSIAGDSSGQLRFYTNSDVGSSTPKMVIDAAGNIGLGTITPAKKLDVFGSASFSESVFSDNVFTKNIFLNGLGLGQEVGIWTASSTLASTCDADCGNGYCLGSYAAATNAKATCSGSDDIDKYCICVGKR